MEYIILAVIVFLAIMFAIYDLMRGINKSIKEQTREIKKLREEISKHKN